MRGRIKALRDTYGFIRGDDGGSYFWHRADQVGDFDVKLGDEVSFRPVEPAPSKGPRAVDVQWESPGEVIT